NPPAFSLQRFALLRRGILKATRECVAAGAEVLDGLPLTQHLPIQVQQFVQWKVAPLLARGLTDNLGVFADELEIQHASRILIAYTGRLPCPQYNRPARPQAGTLFAAAPTAPARL